MLRSAVVLVLALFPLSLSAQDVFPEVEYFSGHAGMDRHQKGILLLSDSVLRLNDANTGAIYLEIPLAGITEVGNQTDVRDASVGKKIMFGFLAGSRKQDFVQITYETVADG
jgi:hypothetical protein